MSFSTVTWLKDNKPIDEKLNKYQFVMDGSKKFKFEIMKCSPTDIGQYTAKAEGKKAETVASFMLNVISAGDE